MNAFIGSLIVAVLTIAVQFTLARRSVLLEFSKERKDAYTSYLEACLVGVRHVKPVRDIAKTSATATSQNPQYYDLLRTKIIEQSFVYESQIAMGLARVHIVAPVKYRKETFAINSAITQYDIKRYTHSGPVLVGWRE